MAAPTVRLAQPPSRRSPHSQGGFADMWSRRNDPQLQVQAALAAAVVLALGLFVNVVEDYLNNDPMVRWDVEFSRWLHVHSNGALVAFFKVATWAGNVAVLALLVCAVSLLLIRRGRVELVLPLRSGTSL